MDKKPVDLVRVPREEKYYDREEVLGRDATSVFPNESKQAFRDSEPVKQLLAGNRKFISETELFDIKASHGGVGRVEDGSVAPDKPLVEVLREQKEAKEAAFQDQWRLMKTGKNRPLDEDEMEFLDSIADAEAQRLKRIKAEEEQELMAFHEALQKEQEAKKAAEEEAEKEATAKHKQQPPTRKPAAKAKAKPIIQVKRVEPTEVVEPETKRQKTTAQDGDAADRDGEGGGLGALLGGYGSD